MKIGIIGLGKMGEAIAKGLMGSKDYRVYFNEADAAKRKKASNRYKRIKHLEINELIGSADVVVLAVKPQDLKELLHKIKLVLKRDKLFISIAAGVSTCFIKKEGSIEKIVRAMPNMGALIGDSFTALAYSDKVLKKELNLAKKIFSVLGKVHVVEEELMDAVTALSGSGPAYFAYFLQALESSASDAGLKDISGSIVLDTMEATLKVLRKLNISTEDFIRMVKSPGGTTEACLEYWQERDLPGIVREGVNRALNRAKELNR